MILRSLMALALIAVAMAFLYGVIGLPPTAPGKRIILSERAARPAPGEGYDVLVLGTSLTSRGDWPELLQDRLNACATGPVRVERLARAGAASGWGLAALRDHLSDPDADPPDLLIVEFSGNDASLARGFPLFISKRNHRGIIQLARQSGAAVILATMSPAWGRDALERPGQDRYHALYRDLASSDGVGLIDTISDWRALSPEDRRASVPDGLHPTREAMAAIAVPAFMEAVGPIVCGRWRGRGVGNQG